MISKLKKLFTYTPSPLAEALIKAYKADPARINSTGDWYLLDSEVKRHLKKRDFLWVSEQVKQIQQEYLITKIATMELLGDDPNNAKLSPLARSIVNPRQLYEQAQTPNSYSNAPWGML